MPLWEIFYEVNKLMSWLADGKLCLMGEFYFCPWCEALHYAFDLDGVKIPPRQAWEIFEHEAGCEVLQARKLVGRNWYAPR